MIVQICVGSSCYLKGSEKLVELFQKTIQENKLDNEIILTGRFCSNKCNRLGVTITIDDDIFTGITPETFDAFFKEKVMVALEKERAIYNGMSNS